MEKNLPKKGFEVEESGHHKYFYHTHDGKRTSVYTYISHSKKLKDISGGLINAIKKQLQLESSRQVADLINCQMTQEQYIALLTSREII